MPGRRSKGLQSYEVKFVVSRWIGTNRDDPSSGLAWFTHDELTEFLAGDCGVPDFVPGVTEDDEQSKRERLTVVMERACIKCQAAIVEGLLRRADLDPPPGDSVRKRAKIKGLLDKLKQADEHLVLLDMPVPDIAAHALEAVSALVDQGKYMQAVDRIHTALHACVRDLAIEVDVDIEKKDGLLEQFSAVRDRHAAFAVQDGDRATADVLKGLSRALDGINSMRNKHSLAHPSTQPLAQEEARLAVNAGCALLQYVVDRVRGHEQASATEDEPLASQEPYENDAWDDWDDLPFE